MARTLRVALTTLAIAACHKPPPPAPVAPAQAPEPAATTPPPPPPDVFHAVKLSYGPYAAPQVPTWVLLEPTAAPSSFEVLQTSRPPGSTVTGQPALWIGPREPFDQPITLVTAEATLPALLTERVTLGIGDRSGVTAWWAAAPIPADVTGPWSRGEVIALRGIFEGLTVQPIVSTERASAGAFTAACGVFPNLHGLTDHRDPDAMLHCFANHVAVINAWDAAATPGEETLASYRTNVFRGAIREAQLDGRFVRLLRRGDDLLVVIERAGELALVEL